MNVQKQPEESGNRPLVKIRARIKMLFLPAEFSVLQPSTMATNSRKPLKNRTTTAGKRTGGSFFTDQRFTFTLAVLLLLFTIFLATALISFLFTGDSDQSKLGISWKELVFNSEIKTENKAGKTGAWLADLLVNQWFGISSFLIIYLLALFVLRFLGHRWDRYRKNVTLILFTIVWMSLAMGLLFGQNESGSFLYPGGKYGLVVSGWISSLVGKIGTGLILVGTGFLAAVLSFRGLVPWLALKMKRKPKPLVNERASGKEGTSPGGLPASETALSKIIGDEDVITTLFDPDEHLTEEEKEEEYEEEEPEPGPEEKPVDFSALKPQEPEPLPNGEEEEEEFPEGIQMEDYNPRLDLAVYRFPGLDLLDEHKTGNAEVSNEELISNKNRIVETLRQYKIEITKIRATIGPTITLYEIVPAPGIRIVKIKNLESDIALSLAALGIRIIAPIPGRGTIGIEVPNQNPELVSMRSILGSRRFLEFEGELPVAIGKTISNETYVFDLTKMPHILVAGATGQGKSVGLNVIIASLLYKMHPAELKFVFIDPKKVELNLYSVIEKHYLAKLPSETEAIISDIQKVKYVLTSLTTEMSSRYDLLKKAHSRNVKEYNEKFVHRRLNPEKGHRFLPYIVVVVDEFADLIMTAGKEIEIPLTRIAQLARAVGIHMIIATQRPSTNIITGTIKANFPTRIAFKVASMIDSRTILDTPGANQLIGKGDMLISAAGTMTRVQCAFMDTPEVERLCKFIGEQRGYPTAFALPEVETDGEEGTAESDLSEKDELFDDAARLVVLNQLGSTSMIQRKLAIGYNRAGRIMDQLEKAGIVGQGEGSKPRQVYIQDEYSLEQLLKNL